MNAFGFNHYIVAVDDDVYEFQGYRHELANFLFDLASELGYDGFYKKDVKVYTI